MKSLMLYLNLIALLAYLLIGVSNAYAGLFSSGSEKKTNNAQEQSLQQKKTLEQKQSWGKKKTKTTSTKLTQEEKQAIEHAKEITSGFHITVTVPISTVIVPAVVDLEQHGNLDLFRSCKVFSQQRTLANFLKFEQDGVVDLIAKQYFENVAAQGGTVQCSSCVAYARCLVQYGAVLAQATINIVNDLNGLEQSGIVKIKKITNKNNQTVFVIRGISFETLKNMFEAEIIRALKTHSGYFFGLIKSVRLSGDRVRLQHNMQGFLIENSGHSVYVVVPRECKIDGMPWVSEEAFGGVAFNVQVSRGWSYKDALDQLKASSRLKEKAEQVERFAEYLKSKGMAKEYVVLLKNALELLEDGKTNFDPQDLVR